MLLKQKREANEVVEAKEIEHFAVVIVKGKYIPRWVPWYLEKMG